MKKILIIVFITLCISLGLIYNKNIDKNTNKNNIDKVDSIDSIDANVLNKLLNIINHNDKEGINNYSNYDLLLLLKDNNGKISDFSSDIKRKIIFLYAYKTELLGQLEGEDYSYCKNNLNFCYTINKADVLQIASLYNIDNVSSLYSIEEEYNDNYLYQIEENKVMGKYEYKIDSYYDANKTDIILNISLIIKDIDDINIKVGDSYKLKLLYKIKNNEYYLDTVEEM